MALGGKIKVEAVQVSLWRCRASLSDLMKAVRLRQNVMDYLIWFQVRFIFKNIKIYSDIAVVTQKFTIFAFKSY